MRIYPTICIVLALGLSSVQASAQMPEGQTGLGGAIEEAMQHVIEESEAMSQSIDAAEDASDRPERGEKQQNEQGGP